MDRISEWTSYYDHLEKMSVLEILENINREDQKVALVVKAAIPQIEQLVNKILPRMIKGGRLFYIGAGTSGRLGVVDASECPPTFGVPHELVVGIIAGGDSAIRKAVEHAEDNPEGGWADLGEHQVDQLDSVIGIAASGTTPYVVGAIEKARNHGMITGGITSNPGSPLAIAAEFPIEVAVGPEFITGSSRMKSGTAQKLVLNMITTSLLTKLGCIKGNKMVDMQLTNNKLIDRGTKMVMDALDINFDKANQLLLKYGSVRKAIDQSSSEL